ncbi:MAG TPA: inorganic phosphate transporter [Natronosporangium sp.]
MVIASASLFALFTGFNDAGAMISVGLRAQGLGLSTALAVLTGSVVAAPVLIGTAVATTLDGRLVRFPDGDGRPYLLIGVAAAVAVTIGLAGRRLPTSLTLALVGGIAGAGAGAGAHVDWLVVVAVLAAAAAAPVIGAVAALAACRLVGALPAPKGAGRRLRRLHIGAFLASCLAYGANDGQKILAVYAAVTASEPAAYARTPAVLLPLAGCFLIGALLGGRRLARGFGAGLATTNPQSVVVTELSGAAVVLGTASVGAPVSMTQSLSGALVGANLSGGRRRVKWRGVVRLGRAWLLTLPAAFAVGAAGSAALAAAS